MKPIDANDIFGANKFAAFKSCSYSASKRFTIKFTHNYKCYDDYNNYVPKGTHDGVSAGIAASSTSAVSATVKFKYTAKVANNDACEVKKFTIWVDSSSKTVSSAQTVASGKTQSVSAEFNLLPGTHTYKIKLMAEGLLK